MTNLILSLLISTNATFHWERSPDPTVTGYVMYGSPFSRYTNEKRAVQQTLPTLPGQTQQSIVLMRSVCVGTNADWIALTWKYPVYPSNSTQWVVHPTLDNFRRYYAVVAKDNTGAESDFSNEVLYDPRWAYLDFCVEGSTDLRNWEVLGTTNLFRFWNGNSRSGVVPAFFRGRLVITNK